VKFTIIGAGAIGGVTGAALDVAGHDVVFVEAAEAHRNAIATHGLRITGHSERVCHAPVLAPEEIGDLEGFVVLAVKSHYTAPALAMLKGRLAPDGCVISLQNGLNEYQIADMFGAERTVGAYLTFGGFLAEPGVVHYAGEGSFKLGELDGSDSARLRSLVAAFSALQPVEATDNIFGFLWTKMALGAVYYGTAVLDRDVPAIYADARAREALGQAAREVAQAAIQEDVRLEQSDGFDPRAFYDRDPAAIAASWEAQRHYWARHTGNARTGVWRDLAIHKRKTEGSAHLGAVIDAARRHSVATPMLDRISQCVRDIEVGSRPLGWSNLDFLVAARSP